MKEELRFKLNGRIWVETENGRLLGIGRVELLERIKNSGSIRQAALQMKMSYKQAWELVDEMNSQLDAPVVISQRGGKGGGTARVTEKGEKVILQFHLLHKKFQKFLKAQGAHLQL